ncbi:DoxX family protein [Sphingomonas bisphenolicum]|uniref:DoxX family protein n=1 Tax=Sphingomonas bisphenolicum TaxID=296544 RepID=UPI0021C2E31B|nr:DoxX family protein [Sphingomonas bisphenolicum]
MNGRQSFPQIVRRSIAALLSLLLAAFFAFVGYMKATAPVSELAKYHAWTVHLPEWMGRTVGWSEIACAILLLVSAIRPRWGRIGALALLINQLFAAAVHFSQGEIAALPQNGVIIALCTAILILLAPSRAPARSAKTFRVMICNCRARRCDPLRVSWC